MTLSSTGPEPSGGDPAMSRSGRPAYVGGSGILRDPNVTQLMYVCGEHIDLVVDTALQVVGTIYNGQYFLRNQFLEQGIHVDILRSRPLDAELQSRYADCRCSPFGRLLRRNAVISGSMAEGLCKPGRPPNYQSTSDVDIMVELGPVLSPGLTWTFPGNEETSPVEETAAGRRVRTSVSSTGEPTGGHQQLKPLVGPATETTGEPRGQDSDPTRPRGW